MLILTAAGFAALGLAAALLARPWVAVVALVSIGVVLMGVASLGPEPSADVGHDDMGDTPGAILAILFYVVPTFLGCATGVAVKYGRRLVRRSDWLT